MRIGRKIKGDKKEGKDRIRRITGERNVKMRRCENEKMKKEDREYKEIR